MQGLLTAFTLAMINFGDKSLCNSIYMTSHDNSYLYI